MLSFIFECKFPNQSTKGNGVGAEVRAGHACQNVQDHRPYLKVGDVLSGRGCSPCKEVYPLAFARGIFSSLVMR